MIVKSLDSRTNSVSSRQCLLYLSQIILSKIDERISEEKMKLLEIDRKIKDGKASISEFRSDIDGLTKRLSREKALSRVLSTINTLNREGALVGRNKIQVRKVLFDIDNKNYNYEKLRDLEEKLSIKLPNK